MRFSEVAAAWSLAVLINADKEYATRWDTVCSKQVAQAQTFLSTSGEQSASGHTLATLMWYLAVACIVIHQAVVSWALSVVQVRRFKSLLLSSGQRLEVNAP